MSPPLWLYRNNLFLKYSPADLFPVPMPGRDDAGKGAHHSAFSSNACASNDFKVAKLFRIAGHAARGIMISIRRHLAS